MIIKCPICSKDFYAKPSHVAKGRKYCTKDCFDKWQRDNKKLGNKSQRWKSIKRICKVCGKEFYRCPAKITSGRGIYCSKECYHKGMIGLNKGRKLSEETRLKLRDQKIGILNPAYIDGRSYKVWRYESKFTKLLKDKIYELYGRNCFVCTSHDPKIYIHHRDFDSKNNDIANLIPLCSSCHQHIHYIQKIL